MNDDKEIKALFSELSRDEEQTAPGFATVWRTAWSRLERQRRRRHFLGLGALATGVVVLGVSVALRFDREAAELHRAGRRAAVSMVSVLSPERGLPWRTTLLASEWRAPTDFLLEPPESSGAGFQFNSLNPNP